MGERGDADVLLVHAPSAEDAFMTKGRGLSRALVMHMRSSSSDLRTARRTSKGAASAQGPSRRSPRPMRPSSPAGTTRDEHQGVRPLEGGLVVPEGAGTSSGQRHGRYAPHRLAEVGYTLTDDGTFLSQRATLVLSPMVEDAKDLRNVYHVIVVNRSKDAFQTSRAHRRSHDFLRRRGPAHHRDLRARTVRPAAVYAGRRQRTVVAQIAALSLAVSAFATVIAGLVAIPGALWIVYGCSPCAAVCLPLYGGSRPSAGRGGPRGRVRILAQRTVRMDGLALYTVRDGLAQIVIVVPLVGTLAVVALRGNDTTLSMQLAGLGIARRCRLGLLAREVAPGLAAAMLAGFGRAIAEVGAAQMTGGNIQGQTRVLTTATMLAVGKGEFGQAFSYVAVLLGIVALATGAALTLQRRWT